MIAQEIERRAMIGAAFGGAGGDVPPRLVIAGETLVGIHAL
ncbi:hypothetical protein ACFSHP_19495 [Novosphingobium panipatense]